MRTRHLFIIILLAGLLMSCQEPQDTAGPGYRMLPPISEADIPSDIHSNSLARLSAVQRSELDSDASRIYDMMTSVGNGYENGLRGPLGMWMYSPQLAEGAWMLRQRVRYGTANDQRLTELTILATAREISNQYEYTSHEPPARVAGLQEEILDFVKFRRPMNEADGIPGMGEIEKLIIQFTREVISEPKVSQQIFAQALQLLGEEGVMDMTGLIGYYHLVAMTLKAFDVQLAPGSEQFMPQMVETLP
jgi:4-carboxymuconolactone decarboxylase